MAGKGSGSESQLVEVGGTGTVFRNFIRPSVFAGGRNPDFLDQLPDRSRSDVLPSLSYYTADPASAWSCTDGLIPPRPSPTLKTGRAAGSGGTVPRSSPDQLVFQGGTVPVARSQRSQSPVPGPRSSFKTAKSHGRSPPPGTVPVWPTGLSDRATRPAVPIPGVQLPGSRPPCPPTGRRVWGDRPPDPDRPASPSLRSRRRKRQRPTGRSPARRLVSPTWGRPSHRPRDPRPSQCLPTGRKLQGHPAGRPCL